MTTARHADDIDAVRSLLRQRRAGRRSLREQLYRLYLVALFGGVAYVLIVMPIGAAQAPAAVVEIADRWAPGALAGLGIAVLVAGARFGTWAGPVLLSRPEVDWLLTSPLPRPTLLRPQLTAGLGAGVGLGALVGLLVGLAATFVVPAPPWSLVMSTAVGWAALGALAASSAWYVQREPRAPRVVMRVSPILMLGGVAAVAAGTWSVQTLWAGPWGWASLPLLAVAGHPVVAPWVAVVLLVVTAVVAVAVAVIRVDGVHHEQVARRAGVRHGLVASGYVLDLRAMSLMREERQRPLAAITSIPVRPPRSRHLTIPWRDAIALARRPGRILWAVGLTVAAVGIAAVAPTEPPVVALAAVVGYFGAAQLLEPMRIEADDPSHAEMLPIDYPRLVVAHGALPVAVLTIGGWCGVGIWTLAGHLPAAAAPAAVALAAGAAIVLVASGGFATVRTSSPLDYLLYGEYGIVPMVGALIKGPMLAAILTAAPLSAVLDVGLPTAGTGALVVGYVATVAVVASHRVQRNARMLADT